MIHITNFNLSFEATANSNSKNIINNFNISINPGEIYVLVGENGVGKTSILNEIVRQSFLPEHLSSVRVSTAFASMAQDVWDTQIIDPKNITTDYYTLQWEQLVNNNHSLARQNTINEDAITNWYAVAISELTSQFEKSLQNYLFEFKLSPARLAANYSDLSPGTKKKILLSILFASNPSALVIDELTNHLDKESIATVMRVIKNTKAAVLLVDHSIEFVREIARNWIYVPHNDERIPIVFKDLAYDEFMSELDSIKNNQRAKLRVVENKHKQLLKARELQTRRAEVFGVNVGAAIDNVDRRLAREIENNVIHSQISKTNSVEFQTIKDKHSKVKKDRLIGIKELTYSVGKNKTQTIQDFKVYSGERIRITGPNGSGKSSLLQLINTQIAGLDINNNSQYVNGHIDTNSELEPESIFVFSQVTGYGGDELLYEYVGRTLKIQDYQVPGFLKKLSLSHYAPNSLIASLSLGELIRMQFGILAATMHSKKLIILDEPGNYLDILTQNTLIRLLNEYSGGVLLVTHSNELAERIGFSSVFELEF